MHRAMDEMENALFRQIGIMLSCSRDFSIDKEFWSMMTVQGDLCNRNTTPQPMDTRLPGTLSVVWSTAPDPDTTSLTHGPSLASPGIAVPCRYPKP